LPWTGEVSRLPSAPDNSSVVWRDRDVQRIIRLHVSPSSSTPMTITTQRLTLVPGTPELGRAELRSRAELAARLGARVPAGWPPHLYDTPAVEYSVAQLECDPEQAGWSFYYFILRDEREAAPVLIGAGGYKGKPTAEGTVEIGYSIVAGYQRRGLATEAAAALVARAFHDARVVRVIAETLPGLTPSIGVLRKNGFRLVGGGSEPGVIRFELTRGEYERRATTTLPEPRAVARAVLD
jgi:RimJ/RimL family protein N-acetyltransferase